MFNNETESCQACPVGTYQDQEIAFSCSSCPVGKTTKDKSSTALSQCLGKWFLTITFCVY